MVINLTKLYIGRSTEYIDSQYLLKSISRIEIHFTGVNFYDNFEPHSKL